MSTAKGLLVSRILTAAPMHHTSEVSAIGRMELAKAHMEAPAASGARLAKV